MYSYEHFETYNEGICGGMALKEGALIVVQNPHDTEEGKGQNIVKLFAKQIDKAEECIATHRNFQQNCNKITVGENRLKKINTLKWYIAEVQQGKTDTLNLFKMREELKTADRLMRKQEIKNISPVILIDRRSSYLDT